MKNALIFVGLVALSVLYLFEVDYAVLSWMNIVAFVIIACTLIPLLIRMINGVVRWAKEGRKKNMKKEADMREKYEE